MLCRTELLARLLVSVGLRERETSMPLVSLSQDIAGYRSPIVTGSFDPEHDG